MRKLIHINLNMMSKSFLIFYTQIWFIYWKQAMEKNPINKAWESTFQADESLQRFLFITWWQLQMRLG